MISRRIWVGWGLAVLVAVGAGCRTGPRFDPRARVKPVEGLTAVALTNQLNPEWLRPPTALYTLGPGDVIGIEIMGESASRSTAIVGPDGRIYFHLLPGMDVWGLTLAQTKAKLETGLKQYLRDQPQVVVTLQGVGSRHVWLLGRLAKPGVYPLITPLTVLEAIATAGGALTVPGTTEDLADLRHSFIIRHGQPLVVDLERLLHDGDMSQNIYLQPDDFLYLKSAESRDVYVLGAVGRGGPVPYRRDLSLLAAIATAGGTIQDAYRTHVVILRGSLTKPEIAIVNYHAIEKGKATDVLLEPRDIVYVPYSPFRTLYRYANMAMQSFVGAIAFNEAAHAVSPGAAPVGAFVPGSFFPSPAPAP